ncbi:MAG TPA: hypothetical protein PLC27_05305 [Saprospiraceae bacterium]|nr:hypothetical protein [Saprospiraceae bacterium]
MRNFRIFLLTAVVAASTFFIYSCTKENNTKETNYKLSETVSLEKVWVDIAKNDLNKIITPRVESRTTGAGLPISSPCFVRPGNDVICSANHITTILNLPASGTRPACSDMKVEYDLVICYNPTTGFWSFDFSDFVAFPGNCPAFMAWYNALSAQQKSDAQDKWEYDLSINEETTVVQGIVTANGIPPNCGAGNVGMGIVNSYTDVCYNRCLTPTKVFPYWKTVKSFCGNQCCQRSRTACVGLTGNILFGPMTFTTKGTACTISPTICPENSIPLSKFCGVTCGPK